MQLISEQAENRLKLPNKQLNLLPIIDLNSCSQKMNSKKKNYMIITETILIILRVYH